MIIFGTHLVDRIVGVDDFVKRDNDYKLYKYLSVNGDVVGSVSDFRREHIWGMELPYLPPLSYRSRMLQPGEITSYSSALPLTELEAADIADHLELSIFSGSQSPTEITSLCNIHKKVRAIVPDLWSIVDDVGLLQIPASCKSHLLGLFKIERVTGILFYRHDVAKIITKHLRGERNILACQEELIDAGFGEFAQL